MKLHILTLVTTPSSGKVRVDLRVVVPTGPGVIVDVVTDGHPVNPWLDLQVIDLFVWYWYLTLKYDRNLYEVFV